jgi:hypothetical protein
MTQQPLIIERPGIDAWRVSNLRLTVFTLAPTPIDTIPAWQQLVGEPPENRNSRPRDGTLQEEGVFRGSRLTFGVDPTRIDWLINPPEDELFIGNVATTVEPFVTLMSHWLTQCPPVKRMAFGAVLGQPVNSHQAGHRLLATYLRTVQIDPDGMSDFLYQVNRRRNSVTPINGMHINRLSRWAVAVLTRSEAVANPQGTLRMVRTNTDYFCRLELDINTRPEFEGQLAPDLLPVLFQELVDAASELASEGDVP